jgi:hypothetical protein
MSISSLIVSVILAKLVELAGEVFHASALNAARGLAQDFPALPFRDRRGDLLSPPDDIGAPAKPIFYR